MLEFGWALPPLAIQFAFGADILWQRARLALAGILAPTLYLSAADAIGRAWRTHAGRVSAAT